MARSPIQVYVLLACSRCVFISGVASTHIAPHTARWPVRSLHARARLNALIRGSGLVGVPGPPALRG
eukprot:1971170-Lingulodinium_polyedra.AAC.1